MKASRSSRKDFRQSLPSGWIGMVKKPSFILIRVPKAAMGANLAALAVTNELI
jgi:hypothetical protein